MSNVQKNPWPDQFDFETDETCQNVFKPFIEEQMAKLADYDARRPDGIAYVFYEHAERVAKHVKNTCLAIGLSEACANNMYWATLPHDIGKQNLPLDVWDSEEKPEDNVKKLRRTHTLLGVQIARELLPDTNHPFMDLMIDIMAYHHEQMDGKGTHGKTADELSMPVRLASIVEAYDGWRIWRPHFGDRDISPKAVAQRMLDEKTHMFDPTLLHAFTDLIMNDTDNNE